MPASLVHLHAPAHPGRVCVCVCTQVCVCAHVQMGAGAHACKLKHVASETRA